MELFNDDAFPSIDAPGSQKLKTVLVFENDVVYNSAEHSADSAIAERIPRHHKKVLRRTLVEGVCLDQIFRVDAAKKLLEFL